MDSPKTFGETQGLFSLPPILCPERRRSECAWLRAPSHPPRLLPRASWVFLRPLVGIPLRARLRTWNRTAQRLLAHSGCPGSPLWPGLTLHSLIVLDQTRCSG